MASPTGRPDWPSARRAGSAAAARAPARAPGTRGRARGSPSTLVALAGTTAYAIALLSYTDNRSSTYLLPYVALPLLIAGALWLALLLRARASHACGPRRGGLAFALAVAC